MFIDKVKIFVKAGDGGDGCISFRREKNIPRGGPDGGDGGTGGNVIIGVDKNLNSLTHLFYKRHHKAQRGTNGKGKNQHGKNGKDIEIKVPPGTVVKQINTRRDRSLDLSENRIDRPEGLSLLKPEDFICIARGGKGGRGNASFATSTNRAPRISEKGKQGQEKSLIIELKLIADVGFVGYPNAGKSTLLSKISDAKPRIASYPFTTLTPNLGVRNIDNRRLTFADIPGIIEGAHKGKGLGLEFLRHIERTSILLYILDITLHPLKDYNTLKEEIRQYNPLILKKPSIIVLNKIDLIQNKSHISHLTSHISHPIFISALRGDNIEELLLEIGLELRS